MVYTEVVPLGCNLVTSDVARTLSTSINEAERLKTLHGSAQLTGYDQRDTLDVPLVGDHAGSQNTQQVPRAMLVRIIQPRLQQILEAVQASLHRAGTEQFAGGLAVLTGGGSETTGIRELAQKVLNRHCRTGRPVPVHGQPELTTGPAFATCIGLLRYGFDPGFDMPVASRAAPAGGGAFGSLGKWLRENF